MPEEEMSQGQLALVDDKELEKIIVDGGEDDIVDNDQSDDEPEKTDDDQEGDDNSDDKKEDEPEDDQEGDDKKEDEKPEDDQEGDDKKEDSEDDPYKDKDRDELVNLLNKKEKHANEQEKMIQRQAQEVGDVRKQLKVKREAIQKEESDDPGFKIDNDKFLEDPDTELKKRDEYNDRIEERTVQKRNIVAQEVALDNKTYLDQHVSNFNDIVGEICDIAAKEGASANQVAEFKANPYTTNLQTTLYYVMKVKDSQYQKQIEELKKRPQQVSKKIEDAAKHKPKKKFAGGRQDSKSIGEDQIANLSDKQLDELIAEGNTV